MLPAPPEVPASPAGPRRFLAIQLPCFRLERCGWLPSEAAVLVAEERSAVRVQALTPAAARHGVLRGMTATEARALWPGLKVQELDDPQQEREDLAALARTLDRLSPARLTRAPDGLLCELHPGVDEAQALRRALGWMKELGHLARGAVADCPDAAYFLARAERGRVLPRGGLAEALAALPLEALDPDPALLERLRAMGIRQAGELAAIPASSVAGRFGAEGLRLHRLARGEARGDPLPIQEEKARLAVRRQLPDPVEQLEALLFVLNELTARLHAALSAADRAVVRLQLRLTLEDAPDCLRVLRLGQPRRAAADLMALLRQRLEGLTLEAPATAVALEVLEDCPFLGRQQGLLDRGRGREPMEELVARLEDALGEGSVFVPAPQARHRPEMSWVALPANPPPRPAERAPGPPRPSLLLREPRPLRVEISPQGEPQAIQVEGRWSPVRERAGPERRAGEWWEKVPFDRDYWALRLGDGRRAWVFRDRGGEDWWLQGWWD